LDFDLAEMYQVETKNLKRSVRRNLDRFPNDINEDTRIQIELINETLAELQTKNKALKPRRPIGYIKPDKE